MPVDRNALVLDVGSGDKPHWRADVLLDKYIDEKYSAQRSGSKETRINHPMFDASAENMPFADKVFDYVICSHVLEHFTNPGKVIGEIMRVGKAGYIEVPFEGSSKITDFESHLWYCKKEENKLIFTAKKQAIFDLEIEKFISKNNIRKTFSKISTDNFDNFIVALYWKNTIEYAVIGEPNLEILNKSLNNSKEEYNNLEPELNQYEPSIALTDFSDGFIFYKSISEKAKNILDAKGKLFFELGSGQSKKVNEIMKSNNFCDIKIVKDYQNHDRVIWGELK